ncbi:MAG TPA: hypothetical protein VNC78_06155 [Actinomycetota bacterium]|nr:hypothetical protein [Actinomycetota bacterium]
MRARAVSEPTIAVNMRFRRSIHAAASKRAAETGQSLISLTETALARYLRIDPEPASASSVAQMSATLAAVAEVMGVAKTKAAERVARDAQAADVDRLVALARPPQRTPIVDDEFDVEDEEVRRLLELARTQRPRPRKRPPITTED